jgi:AcrR family transcriptional regulator
MSDDSPRRLGRPPEADRDRRRQEALDAALAEIAERGYEAVSMLDVARRAHSSKQSLYAWFGDKTGLLRAVILAQSERTNDAVRAALGSPAAAPEVLTAIARGLLNLLLSPNSVALNRAAMGSPELAEVLLRAGRHTTGPLVESYLGTLLERGELTGTDAPTAFRVFYGLAIRDSQIRVLLGEPVPPAADRRRQADDAVRDFLRLYGRS